jgi:uncharacterized membrane protein
VFLAATFDDGVSRRVLAGLVVLPVILGGLNGLIIILLLSGPTIGAWVWTRGGPYYGVPLRNFLGWIVTTFTVYLLYRSVERRWTLQQIGRHPPSLAGTSSPTRR